MADSYSYALAFQQHYTNKKMTLLVQDSYADRTNILPKYISGITGSDYGFSDGIFSVYELNDEIQEER